jgi:hypothetical protein
MGRVAKTILIALLVLAVSPYSHGAKPAKPWQHQDIWLKNELGEKITPVRNSTDPYSPRKTCGSCHGYVTITSGYHFQQGFDQMRDGYDKNRPWVLSPGLFGKPRIPGSLYGRVAAKRNSQAGDMGLSTYDWIAAGVLQEGEQAVSMPGPWIHPGGGPLEYGRKAGGQRDPSKRHIAGEAAGKAPLDGDYSSRYTPDGRSHFQESGGVEGDCLICHMTPYGMDRRNRQLGLRNYRWAATAGAGFGEIQGAVFSPGGKDGGTWNFSRRPTVRYYRENRQIFTGDGKLRGALITPAVKSTNCLQCHRDMDGRKTGTRYDAASDVHIKAGLRCAECHVLSGKTQAQRMRHNIAKGWSSAGTARDDMDGVGMKTCASCHYEGQYNTPGGDLTRMPKNPAKVHREKFKDASFHFYLLHCAVCHIPEQKGLGGYLLDESAGQSAWYTADRAALALRPQDLDLEAKEPWMPWMSRYERVKGDGERYVPVLPLVHQWFGQKLTGGAIRPLPLPTVRLAAGRLKDLTSVEVTDVGGKKMKQPTVATEKDIDQMIKILGGMGVRNAVFVSDRVYELQKGKLVAREIPPESRSVSYSIFHGVAPVEKGKVLGSKGNPDGCTQCHSDNAPFFTKLKVKNVGRFLKESYPVPRAPAAAAQMEEWGFDSVPAHE